MATGVACPLAVIVGETASGKSALALELAERFEGEIICADSRTVYRGMNIGTAKPTPEERARVPHHCLDLVDPNEQFTAADFKRCALEAIADISARGRLPIMVGGTGLYVDSVLYDFQFRPPADPAERERLQGLSVDELQAELAEQGIALPENSRNPRHLVRALETKGAAAIRQELRPHTVCLGIQPGKEELERRVRQRVGWMLEQGLEEEVRGLAGRYGWGVPPLQTIGYQEWQRYFESDAGMEEVRELIIRNTIRYAKRQRTWFKRNNSIHWLLNRDNIAEAVDLTTTLLNN